MAPQTAGITPLAKKFAIAKQPDLFRGIQSVTGLRWMSNHDVLLATAMDRRVLCCDLSAEPPAVQQPGEDAKKAETQPTIPARYLSWTHDKWALHLDVHPDGERVATAGADRLVKIWQWGRSAPLLSLAGHADWVRSVAFSPDGQWLASTGDDGAICLWDADAGELVSTLQCDTFSLETLCWTPDGTRLAAAGFAGKVCIWDVAEQALAASVDTGNFRTIEDEVLNGGFSYPSGIRRVVCSPDGKQLVAAGLYALTRFEISSSKETLKLNHQRNTKVRYFGAAFHPGGNSLAYSMDANLALWDAAAGKASHQIKADQLGMFDLCFLDGGQRLAAGGSKGWIGVWELS